MKEGIKSAMTVFRGFNPAQKAVAVLCSPLVLFILMLLSPIIVVAYGLYLLEWMLTGEKPVDPG